MQNRKPRHSRGIMKIVSSLSLAILTVSFISVSTAAAADEGLIEMRNEPTRGYYLAGDRVSYSLSCPEGTKRVGQKRPDLNFSSGSAAATDFSMEISFGNTPGTFEISLTCEDEITEHQQTTTKSFELRESLELLATVGTVAGECSATSAITVTPGTEVFWCYTLKVVPELERELDDGDDLVIRHAIADSLSSDPISHFYTLDIGEGFAASTVDQGITRATIATDSLINDVTWTVGEIDDGAEDDFYWIQKLSAQATVNVQEEFDPIPDSGIDDETAPDDEELAVVESDQGDEGNLATPATAVRAVPRTVG